MERSFEQALHDKRIKVAELTTIFDYIVDNYDLEEESGITQYIKERIAFYNSSIAVIEKKLQNYPKVDQEQVALEGIYDALKGIKESVQGMQDSIRILPTEIKAASQGRKPHKNEILAQYSIRELKNAIECKKIENKKAAAARAKKRRRS